MEQEYTAIPRAISPIADDVNIDNAEAGAKHTRLPLLPQGRQIARLLEARNEDERPLYRRVVIQMARRSTKTTSITNTLLGRCLNIPGYRVISTAQDGTRSSLALREVIYMLDDLDPDGTMGLWQTFHSNGGEAIHFTNGSRWERRPPKATAFRGAYADCLYLDEAGEYDARITEELIAGALPLMDTRPLGQIIITGTPGRSRSGLLWDSLAAGAAGKSGVGVLDYGMTDADDPADEAVWWRCHPGLASGLTTIDVIRERFETMPLPKFMVEYLGFFPKDAFESAIDAEAWEGTAEPVSRPDGPFTLAFDIAPDASSAALVAAWKGPDDLPHFTLMDHRPGTDWVARAVLDVLSRHPKARAVYDAIGSNLDPAARLDRTKVRGRVRPVAKKDLQAGQSGLVRALASREVFHTEAQPGMDVAAEILQWRDVKDNGRWFGFAKSGGDITPIRGAAMAVFAEQNRKPSVGVIGNA